MSNATIHAPRRPVPSASSTAVRATAAPQHRHANPLRSDKITEQHLERLAIVYVRQSTP